MRPKTTASRGLISARKRVHGVVGLLFVVAADLPGNVAGQTLRPSIRPDSTAMFMANIVKPAESAWNFDSILQALRSKDVSSADSARQVVQAAFQSAARYARDNTQAVVNALKVYATNERLVAAASTQDVPELRVYREAAVVAIALRHTDLQALLDAVLPDTATRNGIASEARDIISRLSHLGRPTVALVADGTVRQALDKPAEDGKSDGGSGTGSIGFAVAFPSGWHLTTTVAVASSVDTVRHLHGSTVLVPGSGSSSISNALIDAVTPAVASLGTSKLSGRFYFFGSKVVWQVDSVGAAADTVRIADDMAVLGVGAGVQLDLLPDKTLLSQRVGVTFNVGTTSRWIRGNGQRRSYLLKQALSGSTATNYLGFEGGVRVDFGIVSAGAQFYYLLEKSAHGGPIAGLTRGQLVIGFSVQGAVIQGPLD